MGGVLLQNGIQNWRSILGKNNCKDCNLLIDIVEAKTEGRIAIENGYKYIVWCGNCGKLNVIRKTKE